MNAINNVKIYESAMDVVYPKYSTIVLVVLNLSGFREHIDHLYIGFGTFGATRQGIIGIKIEVINVVAETIPEYINFFFNFIFLRRF